MRLAHKRFFLRYKVVHHQNDKSFNVKTFLIVNSISKGFLFIYLFLSWYKLMFDILSTPKELHIYIYILIGKVERKSN